MSGAQGKRSVLDDPKVQQRIQELVAQAPPLSFSTLNSLRLIFTGRALPDPGHIARQPREESESERRYRERFVALSRKGSALLEEMAALKKQHDALYLCAMCGCPRAFHPTSSGFHSWEPQEVEQ